MSRTGTRDAHPRRQRLLAAAAFFSLPGVGACSLLFPADAVQCTTNEDCVHRGFAAGSVCTAESVCVVPPDAGRDAGHDATASMHHDAGVDAYHYYFDVVVPEDTRGNDFSCIGKLTIPAKQHTTIKLTVPFENVASDQGVPGVGVLQCGGISPYCALDGGQSGEGGVTNEAGLVTLTVPWGYGDFLKTSWDGALPTYEYLSTAYYKDTTTQPFLLIQTNVLEAVVAGLITNDGGQPLSINPDLGVLIIGVFDCDIAAAPYIKFTIDPPLPPSATMAYLAAGIPNLSATYTDFFGGAAAVNVPVTSYKITATYLPTGQIVGYNSAYTYKGSISYVDLQPQAEQP